MSCDECLYAILPIDHPLWEAFNCCDSRSQDRSHLDSAEHADLNEWSMALQAALHQGSWNL